MMPIVLIVVGLAIAMVGSPLSVYVKTIEILYGGWAIGATLFLLGLVSAFAAGPRKKDQTF